ncbi:MAG: adenylate kinase [Thermoplasmata archaeon]|nr:MAG: adenylate kinase [Thermoplasmata archaeon]
MRIIVAGIPGAGKTTVLNEVKERREIGIINYGDVMLELAKKKNLVGNRDELRKLPYEKQIELQEEAARKIAEKKDVIIDTHCTIKTPYGYMPGLPYNVLSILKPKSIVLIEADAEDILKRRKKDEGIRQRDDEAIKEIEMHQYFNRMASIAYASFVGATVKVIKNEEGKAYKAAEEIIKVLNNG